MSTALHRRLGPADIEKFSSHYLNEGRKQESWRIDAVEVEDGRLRATVSMRSTYVSTTDDKGFHLTIFSTLEFLSQLMIVYAHVKAGLAEKTLEGWMGESETRSVRASFSRARFDAGHSMMSASRLRRRIASPSAARLVRRACGFPPAAPDAACSRQ
jgi:hypothetical protein